MTETVDLSYLANRKDMRSGRHTNPGRLVRQKVSRNALAGLAMVLGAGVIVGTACLGLSCLNRATANSYNSRLQYATAISCSENTYAKAYEEALKIESQIEKELASGEYNPALGDIRTRAHALAEKIRNSHTNSLDLAMVDESRTKGY
jgi:hypothetical protein